MYPQLSICIFVRSPSLAQSLSEFLSGDRYTVTQISVESEFLDCIDQQKQQLDCLVLQADRELLPLVNRLYEKGILLPAIIFQPEVDEVPVEFSPSTSSPDPNPAPKTASVKFKGDISWVPYLYHPAEVRLLVHQPSQLQLAINHAISQFLNLAPSCHLPQESNSTPAHTDINTANFLLLQQGRLAEKLKERLGYLGVYYKRNPQQFFRHLSQTEKQELLDQLKSEYRQIIFNYFPPDEALNQNIDDFVSTAFFADISVSQVVEIHMELMDQFSKQLKLEGRNEEILLDYRLTLIDVMAHLCEMYRRSIPREL